MATKTVIDIDLNDAAFQKFKANFDAYKAALAESAKEWDAIEGDISKSHKTLAGLVVASTSLVAASVERAEAERQVAHETERATEGATKQSRAWSSIAKSAKDFAGNIKGATLSLLRWSELTGLVSGLLGAGGIWGLDRLAQSVATQRKEASGIGVSPGALRSFGLNFGRVLDNPQGVLTGIFESLSDVTKAAPYGALGLNYQTERSRGPDAASIDVLRALKRSADNFKSQNLAAGRPEDAGLANYFQSRQLGLLGLSIEDFKRIMDRPAQEFENYIQKSQKDAQTLNIDPETQRLWEDFKTKLQLAGFEIENTFVRGLVNLAPSLGHLSEEFTKLVKVFVESPDTARWIGQVSDAFDNLAKYIGTPDFQADVKSFAAGVKDMAEAVISATKWIHSHWPFGSRGKSDNPVDKSDPHVPQDSPVPSDPQPQSPPDFMPGGGSLYAPMNFRVPFGPEGSPDLRNAAFRPSVGPSPVATGDRVAEAHDFFRTAGWTEAQTAGILGNIGAESGFRPDAQNASGHQGIAQWDRTRAAQFRKMFGHDPVIGTYEEQLIFIQWELMNTEKKAANRLRASQTAADAARAVNEGYERSGTTGANRVQGANTYMQQYKDRSVQVQINNQTGGNSNVTVATLGA